MPAKVIVREMWKRYGAVEAVRGVEFAAEPGEIFGLLGPNGAGKTTTLECLTGLREPDRGTLEVCGLDARRRPQEIKQRIGVALQTTALQDQITPREALRMFGSFYREHTSPDALLERFALCDKADARFDTLSGGQRQRLALALAFVNRPEVVVLDEPTTGLDPQARRELHDEIAGMKRDGCTVLLSTHNLEEAERLCDRIVIIDRGQIVATGAPRELIAQAGTLQTVTLTTARALAREEIEKFPHVQEVACEDATTRFRSSEINATLAALTRWLDERRIGVVELHVRKTTLEDVFLGLTRSEGATTDNTNGHG